MNKPLAGFGIGLVVGGIAVGSAALLLTDKTGKERRADLDEFKDEALDKISDSIESIEERLHKLSKKI